MTKFGSFWPDIRNNAVFPIAMAGVMILLGVEWLSRKMMRLA
jgi:hypothetical protein